MAARNKLMILNAGSSSLKFKLFKVMGGSQAESVGEAGSGSGDGCSGGGGREAEGAACGTGGSLSESQLRTRQATDGGDRSLMAVASGVCERVGDPAASFMRAKTSDGEEWRQQLPLPSHTSALEAVSQYLSSAFKGDFARQVRGVGHRVVHGRDISQPVLITDSVRATIQQAADLAPLHNPPNLQGIDAASRTFVGVQQVAVFDTAFHQSMPPAAYTYALPYELYKDRAVRRYGFHGTSYQYLTQQAANMLGRPREATTLIISHLGAGSSMCAVQNGRSIDTSMGLTPLEGLMMGTRCGDIDPAITTYLSRTGMSHSEIDTLMNKRSGFLGLAGSADLRSHLQARFGTPEGTDIIGGTGSSGGTNSGGGTASKAAATQRGRSKLAVDVYIHRVRKYLGAYFVHLGGQVDALVFSAGIGENNPDMRMEFCRDLEFLGVRVDDEKNAAAVGGVAADVSAAGSRVKVLVIPTDEELCIAQQTLEVIAAAGSNAAPGA